MSGNQGTFYDVLPDGHFVMERSMDQTKSREVVLLQNLQWPAAAVQRTNRPD
jgi:hypothetical protein